MSSLHLLSGGAAQGLVSQVQSRFYSEAGRAIEAAYGAVGLMRDKFLAGNPCDVIILTQAQIDDLTHAGLVLSDSARPLGIVKTGVAVKTGEAHPRVDSPEALKAALLAATGIYFPDSVKSTAGIHFMSLLKKLGIDAQVASRLRTFPNGATAMRELAQARQTGLIGCTQVTEILFAPGVDLVARLPAELELATVYTAAVCTQSEQPQAATMLIDLLASPQALPLRRSAGFE